MRIWFNRHFSLVSRVVRLLRDARFHAPQTNVVSHRHMDFSGFVSADEHFIEPDGLSTEDYVAWCLQTAQARQIDWIVPGHEAAALADAENRFAAIGVRMLNAAAAELLPLLNQKDWVYAQAPLSVPRPRFLLICDDDQLDGALQEMELLGAVCIKPCIGVYGHGFHRLQAASSGDLPSDVMSLASWRQRYRPPSDQRRQLLMEYLPGHEYSVDLACIHGEMLAAVVRRKPLSGSVQLISDRPDLCAHAAALVEAFKLHGLINVQFKDAADGSPKLLEINPRASGGIAMSCLSGVNLPAIAYSAVMLNQRISVPATTFGLRVTEVPVAMVVPAVSA
jgi:hypothetical protein